MARISYSFLNAATFLVMIHFLVTRRHASVIKEFFDTWGQTIRERVNILSYEWLSLSGPLTAGTYVFTDLERLLPAELNFASHLADHLGAHSSSYRVLNHPRHWAGRFNLQRLLSEKEFNDFRVWRLHEINSQLRFPVFVRHDNDHNGNSPLLKNSAELQQHLHHLPVRSWLQKKRLMIVEYASTGDKDGIFRKYSAMRVGGDLVPRHVLFSSNWITKQPDLVNDNTVAEERKFQQSFPHREQLMKVFDLAGVTYGRVDYGMKDGRLQIWEINTNPIIVPVEEKLAPARHETQRWSANRILEAFRQLADTSPRSACAAPFRTEEIGTHGTRFISRLYGLVRK
jgi:hypothetical protein